MTLDRSALFNSLVHIDGNFRSDTRADAHPVGIFVLRTGLAGAPNDHAHRTRRIALGLN